VTHPLLRPLRQHRFDRGQGCQDEQHAWGTSQAFGTSVAFAATPSAASTAAASTPDWARRLRNTTPHSTAVDET
jgi:hypothetical protein